MTSPASGVPALWTTLFLVLGLTSLPAGEGREAQGSLLTAPEGSAMPGAHGRITLGGDALTIKVAGLAAGEYTVCMDDGTGNLAPVGKLVVVAEAGDDDGKEEGDGKTGDGEPDEEVGRGGHDGDGDGDSLQTVGLLRLAGETLPFGATSPAALAGRVVSVKDAASTVVLTGKSPSPVPDEPKEHAARCPLSAPGDAPDQKVEGSIKLEAGDGRAVIKVKAHGLTPGAVYSVTIINAEGTAESLGSITIGEEGSGQLKLDSARGDALPFGGGDLAALVGARVEIKDAEGIVVLSGVVCPLKTEDGKGDEKDPPGADEPCEANLSRPDAAPDADAEGEVEIEGEELEVEVEKLAVGTIHDVYILDPSGVADAVKIGSIKADEGGHGEFEYTRREGVTLPFGRETVSGMVGLGVEIRGPDGAVVLRGAIPEIVCAAEEEDQIKDGGDKDPPAGLGGGLPGDDVEPMFVIVGKFDAPFLRGDATQDDSINITDAVFSLNFLFAGGAKPRCLDAADSNDDGKLDITDPIWLLAHLFLGGEKPAAPGTLIPGFDRTADGLFCEEMPAL